MVGTSNKSVSEMAIDQMESNSWQAQLSNPQGFIEDSKLKRGGCDFFLSICCRFHNKRLGGAIFNPKLIGSKSLLPLHVSIMWLGSSVVVVPSIPSSISSTGQFWECSEPLPPSDILFWQYYLVSHDVHSKPPCLLVFMAIQFILHTQYIYIYVDT